VAAPQNGWQFPAGDAGALAAALADWAGDPGAREARGRAAYQDARAHFAPAAVFAQTLALYAALLRN
jgi:glycosyltransferase involved in cell wall biosynthesis